MLSKVSNTNLDVQHESWTRWNVDDELNNNHRDFHEDGIPVIWKLGWIVVEPNDNISIFSMIRVEHPAGVGNFVSNAFVFRSWSICLVKEVTFSKFTCTRCKLPPWIWERFVLFSLESSQISHAYVWSILWFGRIITSTPYVFLAHQATDWFVQGEEVP